MIRFSTALRNAIASNYGMGMAMNKGVIRLYTGDFPASPDLAPTGNLLGEITNNGIAYTPGTNKDTAGLRVKLLSPGIVQKDGNWVLKGSASGEAGWFRWYSSQVDNFGTNTNFIRMDGQMAVDLYLASYLLSPATNVEIEAFTISLPMGQQ